MVTRLKAYKFRFYPTATQRQQLAVEFGNARWVWNRCLDLRSKAWETDKTRHNYVSLNRQVTEWKRSAAPWLADSTACCLTQALIDQDKAFAAFFGASGKIKFRTGGKSGIARGGQSQSVENIQSRSNEARTASKGADSNKNFFEKRGRYPRFKSRYDRQSVRYQLDQRQIANLYQAGERLKLPKLGAVKLRWSQVPAGIPKMATVSKDPSGRYFVAFSCAVELKPLPLTSQSIGVDLGIKDVVVTSDGWKSGNPHHLKGKLKHLKRQQRRLSRMQKGSNRRHRQRLRVARLQAHIAAMRQDFLHKTSTALVRRADVLALEDLHVNGMLRNHRLAGAIADVGMGELRRQIEYKAAWYGRKVEVVDRFAPTSKTCSACGSYQQTMPLSIRAWTCPDCGTRHDRDVNAAKNILKFSTAGEAGIDARGVSKNLLSHGLSTHDEARTEAEKFTEADRMERAA